MYENGSDEYVEDLEEFQDDDLSSTKNGLSIANHHPRPIAVSDKMDDVVLMYVVCHFHLVIFNFNFSPSRQTTSIPGSKEMEITFSLGGGKPAALPS